MISFIDFAIFVSWIILTQSFNEVTGF